MSFPSRTLSALAVTGILVCLAPDASAAPASQKATVEIDDFSYVDTSGEPRDAHQAKLDAFMAALRSDFAADDHYRLASSSCTGRCATENAALPDRLDAAAKAGTNILVTGGIQKLSTLIQWAKVRLIDVSTRHILFEKLYTFRGDNDDAWRHAETFVSQDVREKLASLSPLQVAAEAPTKLAVFPFELEDTSAAAPSNGASVVDAADAGDLTETTDAVRRAIAQSPRYHLVDVSGAHADAVSAHKLRDCGGCDAGIARSLEADQSLVGVVRRVSRTEYTIRVQIRDARTGAVVANADSGLRMGANYSWSRGAARLVSDHLLGTQPQR